MIKVFMMPTPEHAQADTSNAINQIVVRLQKFLPKYGVEVVNSHTQADLIVGHAGQTAGYGSVDVAHCHGLYPTAYPELVVDWHFYANQAVVNNLIGAKQITVPSEWVADIFRRDMHVNPHVVGWAIEHNEWKPGTPQGYVLWNKTRMEGVCNPRPVSELAARLPGQLFLSTFAENPTPNVRVVGRQTFDAMKPMVEGASVYLATTKETFGIATLEAMACGVPILGYRWGGTADLIEHGVDGFLVEPGDFDGLVVGLEYCLKYRDTLGHNARMKALTFTWDRVAEQFADIYKGVLETHAGPKVSVVIPCYNYGRYVGEAIRSVKAQVTNFEFEIIVVDDGSVDDSVHVIRENLPENGRLIAKQNGGVARARNTGIEAALGEYIVCLDADDQLGSEHFLQALADTLDANPSVGVAYTGLRCMTAEGMLAENPNPWPGSYDFEGQVAGRNQVPTCNMFRKVAWERAGGYRFQYQPAEDAELWLRMGSFGFRAMQATTEPWFLYRLHPNSLSATVRTGGRQEPDWRNDKPWVKDGQRPFASDGKPIKGSWPVRNYDQPKISIVIPLGESHIHLLPEALDSVENQTIREWECIVVNDTGKPVNLPGFPWVRWINTPGKKGAAFARNLGVKHARGRLIAFLDADDIFSFKFLEATLKLYNKTGKYIYTDWVSLNKEGMLENHQTPEYEPQEVFNRTSIHSINILIERSAFNQVGGFDESMVSWEDVDFFMKLAAAGLCGQRVPEPLVLYRYGTGTLREYGETIKAELKGLLFERYHEYMEGKKMCGCNSPKPKTLVFTNASGQEDNSMIRIEYNGPAGSMMVIGPATRQSYGRRQGGDIFYVYTVDAQAQPDRFVPVAEPTAEIMATSIPEAPVLING